MDSLEVFLSSHPWVTLLTGMAVPLVASLTFAGYALKAEGRTHPPEPNVWTRLLDRVLSAHGDALGIEALRWHPKAAALPTRYLLPEFMLTSLVRDGGDVIGVSVRSRQEATVIAERWGTALREALRAEGRASATVLFLMPGDFLLLPPSEPVPAPSLGPLHSRSLFE